MDSRSLIVPNSPFPAEILVSSDLIARAPQVKTSIRMVELSSTPNDIRDAFVESLDWWREAGVEEHVSDTPGGWLRAREEPRAAPEAVAAPPPPPPAEPPRKGAVSRFIESGEAPTHPGDPDQWPGDLADFRKWWMESDACLLYTSPSPRD